MHNLLDKFGQFRSLVLMDYQNFCWGISSDHLLCVARLAFVCLAFFSWWFSPVRLCPSCSYCFHLRIFTGYTILVSLFSHSGHWKTSVSLAIMFFSWSSCFFPICFVLSWWSFCPWVFLEWLWRAVQVFLELQKILFSWWWNNQVLFLVFFCSFLIRFGSSYSKKKTSFP